jgi:thiol:disulfide interchange protein DsbD
VEVEIVGITKATALKEIQIPWVQDHDQGLEQAAGEDKPMLLLLYADWCQWSHKMMAESLTDPRIKMFRDRFVWVRVDSEKQPVFKEVYRPNGFPLMLVLDSKGDVLKRIDGYRDAAALSLELEAAL